MATQERELDLSPEGVIEFFRTKEALPPVSEAELEAAMQQRLIELGFIRDPNKFDPLEWFARLLVASIFGCLVFLGVFMLASKNNGIGDIAGAWRLMAAVALAVNLWDHR
jgi:hypothetical protein